MTVPDSWTAGTYTLQVVQGADESSNQIVYRRNGTTTVVPAGATGPTSHAFDLTARDLTISAVPPDAAGPVVSGFDFTPKSVDVNSGEKQIVVSVRLTDATGAIRPDDDSDSDSTSQALGFGTMTRARGVQSPL